MKFFNKIPVHAVYFNEAPAEGGGTVIDETVKVEAPSQAEIPTPPPPPKDGPAGDIKSPNFYETESRTDALKELFKNSKGPQRDEKGKFTPQKPTTKEPTPPAKAKDDKPEPMLNPPKVEEKPGSIPELEGLTPKNPKDVQGFAVLKQKTTEIVNEARAKAATFEKALGEAKIKFEKDLAEKEKIIDELKGYQMAADIHSDPEFQSKFVRPLEAHKSAIKGVLTSIGATQEAINKIQLDDANQLEQVAMALQEKGYAKEAGIVRSKAARIAELEADRDFEVKNSREKWKEITQKKSIEGQAKEAEFKTKVSSEIKKLVDLKDENGNPAFSILNEIKAPADATPALLKQIENHNAFVKDTQEKMLLWTTTNDPVLRAQVALGNAMAPVIDKALNDAHAKIKSLEEELSKIAGASPTPGNRPQSTSVETPAPVVDVNMDAGQALRARFPGR